MSQANAGVGEGELRVGRAVRFGWEQLKKRPVLLLLMGLVTVIVSLASNRAFGDAGSFNLAGFAAAVLIALLLQALVALIWVQIALNLTAGRDISGDGLVQAIGRFVPFLGAMILYGLAVTAGMVLLIVPGIWLAISLMFYGYALIDSGCGPFAALSRSMALVRGRWWWLLGFNVAMLGVNILGILALGVGVLVSIPITQLATGYVYRQLAAHRAATAPPL
jgi:uncharacterized membrane protein